MKHTTHPHHSASKFFTFCILLGLLPLLLAANYASLGSTSIIFLHHSCGQNLIEQGGVREGLTALGYEFYDHGYNYEGLRLADGSYSGDNFDVPDDNTDPDGFAEIFGQPLHDPPDNTFSHLMQYDVIAFKSCYPVSNIWGDEQLDEYKSYYHAIRDRMDQYPDKIFIVVTQPPQVPGSSSPDESVRARAFADWLSSDEFLVGHPNLFTFDFFGHLAGADNFLRAEYRVDEHDGHPNDQANRTIGPLFVQFIDQAISSRGGITPRPTPTPPAETPPPEEQGTEPPPTAGLIDDFESGVSWSAEANTDSTIQYGLDTQTLHGGELALRIGYDIIPDGWGSCGRSFGAAQDWSDGDGISMWLHSDGASEWFTLMLFSGDPAEPTPFEVGFETTAESDAGWALFTFPWADFARADWADVGGLSEIDPARVTGYGFSFSAGEGRLWVDDVALFISPEQPEPTTPPPEEPVEEPTKEPVEEPVEEPEEDSGGGICPGAAALPLGAVGIVLASRQRRK
ncbi:MAG: hypothetical protein KKC18_15225 [Chloroflexi bacterium]|nr:hypothetical protein [Chloroflexota bacterium]